MVPQLYRNEISIMFQQIFLAVIGFCAGVIIAGGVVGLLIGLSIVPRYAGVTHTGKHILLYEDITLLGIVFGNLFFLYGWHIPGGVVFLGLCGLFSGIFLGGWIMALAEMADVFPIFSRRIKLTNGIRLVVIAVALGKILGSLYYFYQRWFP